MHPLLRLRRLLDAVSRGLLAVTTVLLLAMLALINVEVAGRYFFSYSTLISDEYGGYLFCWIVLLGLLYALRHGHLLRVGTVRDRLPPRGRAALDLVNAALGLALSLVVTYAVWSTVSLSWLFQTASNQPSRTLLYLPQAALPLGTGLLALSFLEEAVRRGLAALGRDPEPGP